jgi:Mor family transcriptional regulator
MVNTTPPPNPPGTNVGHQPPELTQDASDLVDVVFAYCWKALQGTAEAGAEPDPEEIKAAIRQEFGGIETYIRRRESRTLLANKVLSMFNGRNPTEVARELNISRATVYRLLKQSGNKSSQFSEN